MEAALEDVETPPPTSVNDVVFDIGLNSPSSADLNPPNDTSSTNQTPVAEILPVGEERASRASSINKNVSNQPSLVAEDISDKASSTNLTSPSEASFSYPSPSDKASVESGSLSARAAPAPTDERPALSRASSAMSSGGSSLAPAHSLASSSTKEGSALSRTSSIISSVGSPVLSKASATPTNEDQSLVPPLGTKASSTESVSSNTNQNASASAARKENVNQNMSNSENKNLNNDDDKDHEEAEEQVKEMLRREAFIKDQSLTGLRFRERVYRYHRSDSRDPSKLSSIYDAPSGWSGKSAEVKTRKYSSFRSGLLEYCCGCEELCFS